MHSLVDIVIVRGEKNLLEGKREGWWPGILNRPQGNE